MAMWLYEAYTPGTRNRATLQFGETTESKSHKQLTYFKMSRRGRNNVGIITSRHRGGGHKRLYRKIDFRRDKLNVDGRVASIEYDPNRNAFICLINYTDGHKRYILHPRGLRVGDNVTSSSEASISVGNALPLSAGWIVDSRISKLIDRVVGLSRKPRTTSKLLNTMK